MMFILCMTLSSFAIYTKVRHSLEDNIHNELRSTTDSIRNMVKMAANVSIKNRLRAIAEKNKDIIASLYKKVQAGRLSEAQAQALARDILKSQTIGHSGYIYVVNSKGIFDHHPSASLVGSDGLNTRIVREQLKKRDGYLEYDWPDPKTNQVKSKALYMVYFEPWNWIISVSSYQDEFMDLVNVDDFRSVVESYDIGESGYIFILNQDGEVVIHPWLQGNISKVLGAKGEKVFARILGKEKGEELFSYWWTDPGFQEPREKILVFKRIPELRWVVASASYMDEMYAPLKNLRLVLAVTSALTLLLVLPVAYYLGASIVRPINDLSESMAAARHGDLSVRAGVSCFGEIGTMANRFNQYMEKLEAFSFELKDEISERIKAEQRLELFAMVFNNALEGICITDNSSHIIEINKAFTDITGYGPDEVLGMNSRILKSDRHDEPFYSKMWESLIDNGSWHGEIWNRRKSGEIYPEILSISSIRNDSGEIDNYIAIFHDISDMKLKDKQIEHHAYYDALTGLPNRTLAQDRMTIAMIHAKRDGSKVALLFFDLDNFKKVNDSFGHAKGDELIQHVGRRLYNEFSEADTVARVGGDEFLIIVEHIEDERDVVALADRLLKVFIAPFALMGQDIEITPSIGVTLYPDDGDSPEILIKNADMAMYQAKAKGKNAYFLFTQEMNERISKRLIMENDMRQALKNNEFTVYFQPQVSTTTEVVTGVEALVRWQKPDGTIVSPGDFIPLAEETGLIMPLGEMILENACKAMQVFDGVGCSDISVSVNLSPVQFEQEDLVDQIVQNLKRNGLSPDKLELEITESTLMTDIDSSVEKLNELSAYGISIAIDDFGTGHSSLYYLKKFPIDVLKVDRSFVLDMTQDMSDAQIVETIILMAKNLGIKVVAEGVETRAQLELLEAFGCELIQGYYFSRPLPLEEMIVYLQNHGNCCSGIALID